jgi:UDPglucose 6-dehydrogenase
VRVWDPIARLDDLHGVDEVATIEEAVAGADAVVLVTEWPELARVDWVALRPTLARGLFVDGRNFLDPAAMRAAGYEYEGVGRAAEALETPVEAPTG